MFEIRGPGSSMRNPRVILAAGFVDKEDAKRKVKELSKSMNIDTFNFQIRTTVPRYR